MAIGKSFYPFLCLLLVACGQNRSSLKQPDDNLIQSNIATASGLPIDVERITVLSSKNIDFFSLKDSIPAALANTDIQLIETLLTKCIQAYNTGLDSSKLYSAYIDLKKYKRQYVPYANVKGEKRVFINCFCIGVAGFDSWKEKLVMIEDGGKCFFNVTIDLATHSYGPVLINGPG